MAANRYAEKAIIVRPLWMIPAVATGAAAATVPSIAVAVAVIGGLPIALIIVLSGVAVFGSRVHSTRAMKVLELLNGRISRAQDSKPGPSSRREPEFCGFPLTDRAEHAPVASVDCRPPPTA